MRAGVVASGLHIPPPSFALADTGGGPSNNPPPVSLSWATSGSLLYAPRQSNRATGDLDGRDLNAMLAITYPEGADAILTRADMPGDHWRINIRTQTDPAISNILTVFVVWADPMPTLPAPAGTRWTFTYSQGA